MTAQQSVLLILAFTIRFGLPETSLDYLLALINSHLPTGSLLPRTSYYFRKLLNKDYSEDFTYHFECDKCDNTVTDQNRMCPCGNEVDTKKMKGEGRFFVIFNIAKQIESLLSVKTIAQDIFENLKRRLSTGFGDIWNGELYKRLKLGKYDLTSSCNTDGMSIFKSSKFCLWPILYSINELSYSLRRKNVLVGGLWFGKGKPNFHKFFAPVVTAFTELVTNGITWQYMSRSYQSSVYLLSLLSDSMARCVVQGITQHNGMHGCNYCLIKSDSVKNVSGKRVYLPCFPPPKCRTKANYMECLEQRNNYGVLNRSCLLDIPYFDIIWGCPVDYMHGICLGVVKYVTLQMLDTTNRTRDFYIGGNVVLIDKALASVKVPWEIPRVVRPLSQVSLWKANEYRTWLFVAPIVLQGYLPKRYLDHFSKLSSAVYILLCENISSENLLRAETLLLEYVCDTYALYGESFCTYNLHLLTHLGDCVRHFGSLHHANCFMFEAKNVQLAKLLC